MYESKKFYIYLVGHSEDSKTNEWRFICKKCKNKYFTMSTTILAKQMVKCPKCEEEELINYNKL